MKSKSDNHESRILAIYFAVMLCFLMLPLLLIIPTAFSETRYLKFPPTGFTLRWFADFFQSAEWMDATVRSLSIGVCSATLSVIVGTAASFYIDSKLKGFRVLNILALGPQIIPSIILALGILLFLSKMRMLGTYPGIIVAHAALSCPFVLLAVSTSLKQNGTTLEQAARVLGANVWQTFWYVTLPRIKLAVISAWIFAFFISFDEIIISLFTMGGKETLPMRIWADMRQDLTPVVAAASSILVIVTLVAIFTIETLKNKTRV